MSDTKHNLGTMAIHAGQKPDPTTAAIAVPIYASASYVFESTEHAADLFALKESGHIYSRLSNPTNDVLEKRLAALDGGAAALTFASGSAAISAAVLTLCKNGQNLISSTSLYGGTWTLFNQTLKKFGIEVRFFNPDHPEKIAELADENTRLVYMESVGNPKNDVPDFRTIADAAHAQGVPLVVDNTVLTPILFRPIEHGADIVAYSTTKFLAGHGVHIGGALVDAGSFGWADDPDRWADFAKPDPSYHGVVLTEAVKAFGNIAFVTHVRTHWLRDTGGCMSPFAAFLTLLGVETVHLRVPRHAENAQRIAEWLSDHPAVAWVNYPGLKTHPHHANAVRYLTKGCGGIMGFGIKGGAPAGVKFINNVKLCTHLANIGDARTLVIHPASTTHSQLSEDEQATTGVSPEYIRLSVGIEDADDIIADLDQALKASQS